MGNKQKQPRHRRNRKLASSMQQALAAEEVISSVRIQLTLKPKWAEKVETLRNRLDVDSYSDAIRDAVDYRLKMLDLLDPNDKLVVEKANGQKYYVT